MNAPTRCRKLFLDYVVGILASLTLATTAVAQGPAGLVAALDSPTEISSLEVRELAPDVELLVNADAALIWTQYRGLDGRLVIEMPNTRVQAEVGDLAPTVGLVSAVTIEREETSKRPLSRLMIETREPAEHALAATSDGLVLRFKPIARAAVLLPAADAAPANLRLADAVPPPAPATIRPPETDSPLVPATEPTQEPRSVRKPAKNEKPKPDTERGWPGTADRPYRAPAPEGEPATILSRVESLRKGATSVLLVSGDGEFAYTTFELEDPQRFVIDLPGVVKTDPQSSVVVDGPVVEQVRMAQFKSSPSPVARVVFDLSSQVTPQIASGPRGLRVRFGSTEPEHRSAEPAAPEVPELPEVATAPEVIEAKIETPAEPIETPAEPVETWTEAARLEEPSPIDESPTESVVEEETWTATATTTEWSEPEPLAAAEPQPESVILAAAPPVTLTPVVAAEPLGDDTSDAAESASKEAASADAQLRFAAALGALAAGSPAEPEVNVEAQIASEPESATDTSIEAEDLLALEPAFDEPPQAEPIQLAQVSAAPAPVPLEVALEPQDPQPEPEPVPVEIPVEEVLQGLGEPLPEPEPAVEAAVEVAEPFIEITQQEPEETDSNDDLDPDAGPEEERRLAFGVQDLTGQKQYFGEPISLSVKDADVTEILRTIARISGLNMVIQPGISGGVTVELESVPWDQALEQILKIHRLGMELDGNILRIAPVALLSEEAQEQIQLRAAKALSVPLSTIMRRVSYAQADEIASILRSSGGGRGVLSQRGSVVVDRRTNTLIIQELPGSLDAVLSIVDNLDTPEEQVMIEARIVETSKNWSRSLGIQWNFTGIADNSLGNTTGLQFPNNIQADGGANLFTGGNNGFLNIGLGNVLNTFELDMSLIAAENEGLVNVISAPKIATLNNERASIQSGLQIPIQTVANNTVTVQFVNATLRLDVTPHVTADGTILMEIHIQKREPQLAFAVVGAANAPIATREARTRVLVRDGGTTVIGGIYEVSTDDSEDRVPGLADLPLFGRLFRNKARSNNNEELLIFITPRVVHF